MSSTDSTKIANTDDSSLASDLDKSLSDSISKKFSNVEIAYVKPDRIRVNVKKEDIIDVASFIRDELNFDHAESVSGDDYPEDKQIEVQIKSLTKKRLNDRTSESWKSLKELKKLKLQIKDKISRLA